jgi:hypothetical protein
VRADQYQTTLTGILNGSQTVFQESFSLPFSDPSVQAAVLAADAILNGDAATYGAPILDSTSTVLQGSQISYQQTGQTTTITNSTTTAFGPATIDVGPNLGQFFYVLPGQEDININSDSATITDRNAITTSTYPDDSDL